MHYRECFDNSNMFKAQQSKRQRKMAFAYRLLTDETGGEVLEYALIAGLIVVGSIAMVVKVGTRVLARWGSLNSSL
jgi:Flp pilus assembly pilin Flp